MTHLEKLHIIKVAENMKNVTNSTSTWRNALKKVTKPMGKVMRKHPLATAMLPAAGIGLTGMYGVTKGLNNIQDATAKNLYKQVGANDALGLGVGAAGGAALGSLIDHPIIGALLGGGLGALHSHSNLNPMIRSLFNQHLKVDLGQLADKYLR